MTKEVKEKLIEILSSPRFDSRLKALKYLETVEVEETEKKPAKWSDSQRGSFYKGCTEFADYLNSLGLDMKTVLKAEVNIPWDKKSVDDYIFRPLMKAKWNYDSHKQLEKAGEVSTLWDLAMKHLGERSYTNNTGEKVAIEYMEFPHDKEKQNQRIKSLEMAANIPYPENPYDEPPTI